MQLITVSVYIRQLAIDQLIPIDVAGLETFIDRSVLVGLSLMALMSHWIRIDFYWQILIQMTNFQRIMVPIEKDELTI